MLLVTALPFDLLVKTSKTIIIGDSNTNYLKFSTGQLHEKGTFRYNMTGERVETFHISQIDERKCLGYRNRVI